MFATKREDGEGKKYEIVLTTQDDESRLDSGYTSRSRTGNIFCSNDVKSFRMESSRQLESARNRDTNMPRGHSQFFTQYVGGFTRSFTHDSAYMSETDTVQRRRVQNLED